MLSIGVLADNEIPPYAKWGSIAIKETIKKYPNASVIDYLHIGRENKTNQISIEKFKLWLRENNREFGVFVDVEFDPQTNQFRSISFRETDR
ncbi:YqzG/YhdC family protein [Anaerobacillus alkalidiazotrophicus]|nr:YqzG/YhdC family protein [Anaerobacillus alkalidiazotrophicus]